MGDVKLALVLGLVLGALGPWQAVLGPMAAFLSAGVVALASRVLGRWRGDGHLAFGPFMLGGFWGAVALSPLG
jgi:leader peptidase (prepilin peptidase)/N-methyltransferase